MSILEELYDGSIDPSNKRIIEESEYQKINAQLTEYIDRLISLLGNEEKEICEKICDEFCKLCYITEKERFIEGYRIGAKTVWEIINYKSKNFI